MSMEKINIYNGIDRRELFGNLDSNLKIIEVATKVEIVHRDDALILQGENVELAKGILEELMEVLVNEESLDKQKVNYIVNMKAEGISYKENNVGGEIICYTHQGKPLKPKTIGQKNYVNKIRNNDIVFGIGPAGTGKTYIACALAVSAYKNKEVEKIILSRPAVEAGENLGFLPGDLQEKVDPYLRPLYDALYDVLGKDAAERLKEKDVIEIVPLAYMRGRTLDNAFIILDEAQNTTREQMKMFLTRMGSGSKVVVTGDITQIDLPKGTKSGLVEVIDILKDVKGIEFCYLTSIDVVRHELVKKIINAYEAFKNKEN
ncbi:MAG: PhoH family protein [Peptostreptococcaceae bacterium]|nr:PhoH family protein [Peptostreptococcaceae bacterium]